MALQAAREKVSPAWRGDRAPREPSGESVLRALCALLGIGSVVPLLAWGFGWGSFQLWFWGVALPSQLLLLVIGLRLREERYPRLHTALRAGVVGGVIGTLGYDLVRVPFEAGGMRVFLPIDSYGILIAAERTSTPLTGFLGWAYHFSNGIGFGVSYACVALGRRWVWALPWAIFLETAFIVTPLGQLYGIQGQWAPIAVAYGGHIAYGVPLGVIVATAGRPETRLKIPVPVTWVFAGLLIYLLALHQPFVTAPADGAGRALSLTAASAVVRDGRFHPQWLRTAVGGCAIVRDDDAVAYHLVGDPALPPLLSGRTTSLCFAQPGVVRVRTGQVPYSGGVALADPGMAR